MDRMADNSLPASSLQEMTHLIRMKEKELHDVHDMRCGQLEKMIDDRDHLLLETTKRFEQLKDDFQYNLALLEARDQELNRLDNELAGKEKLLGQRDDELKALSINVAAMERRHVEVSEKQQSDKAASKRILQELKEVIESMKWAATEEAQSKSREIDALKQELIRTSISRDEALESQRRDLTHTFEQLLRQREDAFIVREREIAGQVAALETRFEQLITDNSRLKAELQEANRRIETTTDDVLMKEDHLRQLQWRLEDERVSRHQQDDDLKRKLANAALELAAEKDRSTKEVSEAQSKIEKISAELQREKEFRRSVDRRLEEARSAAQSDIARLEKDVQDMRDRENKKHAEVMELKEERDTVREKVNSLKLELHTAVATETTLQQEVSQLRRELAQQRNRTIEAEALADRMVQDAKAVREELVEQARLVERATSDREAMHLELMDTKARLEGECMETKKALENDFVNKASDLRADTDMVRLEMEIKLASLNTDLEALRSALADKNHQLEEEQRESAALRLRLQLHETAGLLIDGRSNAAYGRSSAGNNNDSSRGIAAVAPPPPPPPGNRFSVSGRHHSNNDVGFGGSGEGLSIASPVFSEDFGPLSIPASPQPMAFPHHGLSNYHGFSQQRLGLHRDEELETNQRDSADSGNSGDENERLKRIIKDMRSDMEHLRVQAMESSRVSNDNGRIESLEKRLEQTVGEVTRLRTERKRLMDVGNELRSQLNKVQGGDLPGHPQPYSEWNTDEHHDLPQNERFKIGVPQSSNESANDADDVGDSPYDILRGISAKGLSSSKITRPVTSRQTTNSDRATQSQIQARQKLAGLAVSAGRGAASIPPRKVMNYARPLNADER